MASSTSSSPLLPFFSSPSSSSSMIPVMKDGEYKNWAELPPDLTSSILQRLGSIDILRNAQKVCRSWRRVCKDPSMWRRIDMHNLGDLRGMGCDLEVMCRHAVDRSQGGLLQIDLWYFGTDKLLNYIADSSSNLRSLKLAVCYAITDEGFVQAIMKLPLLEDLEISNCSLSGESLRVVGQSCPNLKTLKLNCDPDTLFDIVFYDDEINDEEAIPIAETMPQLRYLQLVGNSLTNTGLNAILDGCPHLEYLDLRNCVNIELAGDMEKRCVERINYLRRPNDSLADHPYGTTLANIDFDHDYNFF